MHRQRIREHIKVRAKRTPVKQKVEKGIWHIADAVKRSKTKRFQRGWRTKKIAQYRGLSDSDQQVLTWHKQIAPLPAELLGFHRRRRRSKWLMPDGDIVMIYGLAARDVAFAQAA